MSVVTRIPLVQCAHRAPRCVAPLLCLLLSVAPTAAEQLPLKCYPPESLPQVTVQILFQDSRGFLWLGTQDGLARYDGHEFTSFGLREGLAGTWISDLMEDRQHRLWVATNGGVTSISDDGVRAYAARDGLRGKESEALALGTGGEIYVGTDEELNVIALPPGDGGRAAVRRVDIGLPPGTAAIRDLHVTALGELLVELDSELRIRRGDGTIQVFDAAHGFPGERRCPSVLAAGDTLFLCGTSGISRYARGQLAPWPAASELPRGEVTGLALTPAGELVAATERALWIIRDPRSEHPAATMVRTPFAARASGLVVTAAGELWGTADALGVFAYDMSARRFQVVDKSRGLPDDDVRALLEDAEGLLWMGTSSGLCRVRSRAFSTYTVADGLPDDTVWAIERLPDDPGGRLIIGTSAGLSIRSGSAWVAYGEADGLAGAQISSLAAASPTTVYAAGRGGVTRVDLAGSASPVFTAYTAAAGFPAELARTIAIDREQRLFVGHAKGISELAAGRFLPISVAGDLKKDSIWSMISDAYGRVWAGGSQGLVVIDGGVTRRFTTADGLLDDFVFGLAAAPDGAIWLSYLQPLGITRLELGASTSASAPPRLGHHLREQGLARCFFVGVDRLGLVWLGTGRGLVRFDGKAFRTYGIDDGLPWADFNANAFFADRDGSLWFGSKGAVHYEPTRDRIDRAPPPRPTLTSAVLGETPAAPNATAAYARRNFRATFTALSYANEEALQFRSRLRGYDEQWSPFDANRSASFTNLAPGDYLFEVEARTKHGRVSAAPASFAFSIAAPYYLTSWFRALVLTLLGCALAAAHKLRIARAIAAQRRLEALVCQRTQELETEKKEVELQRQRAEDAAANLDEANHKLLELDRLKTQFFSNISHEFRTPLTLILGPLEAALAGEYDNRPEKLRAQLEVMRRSSQRLLRLINQLLDISKLEAGRMRLEARPTDLVDFLRTIASSFAAIAERKRIQLDFHGGAASLTAFVDPDKFEKIVFNLLSNAFKFTPEHGMIRIDIAATGERAELSVADSGRGIPAGELPHVFDRFRQVDGSTTREQEGTGIGLALVKELVELHHGTVSVRSELGAGTTFTVCFPLGTHHLSESEVREIPFPSDPFVAGAVPEKRHPDGHAGAAAGGMPEPADKWGEPRRLDDRRRLYTGEVELTALTAKKGAPDPADGDQLDDAEHVLIVEDNADMRAYIRSALERDYQLSEAADGQEGLARAHELHPDLIVSDVMMPRLDGYGLLSALKSDPQMAHVPLILLTAKAGQDMRVEGLEAGADDYLAKPFNTRELLARVRGLLRLTALEREIAALTSRVENTPEGTFRHWHLG
ncbi:MAG: response regulator [Candidatus Schekmanbacteria bacterium]|nr:response regulator [Candidatus Schekmanbacteria bacterium]